MDGLALLCTLHADGPTTLKRLRAAGCFSLESLLGFEAEELARLIDLPAARARRLKREARLLGERISGELLQPEESAPREAASSPGPVGATAPPAMHTSPFSPRRTTEATSVPGLEGAPTSAAASLTGVERRLMGKVLEHWNEKQALAEASSPEVPASEPRDSTPPVHSPSVLSLEDGWIDGLDARLAKRLAEIGVHSVEDLVAGDADELAAELSMAFGALRRLQFLGARVLESRPRPEAHAPARAQAVSTTAPSVAPIRPSNESTPRREASAKTEARMQPPPPPAKPVSPGPLPAARPLAGEARPRTVLDWSFEIPRPAEDAREEAEQPGGPFA
jgi:hypothetical protein